MDALRVLHARLKRPAASTDRPSKIEIRKPSDYVGVSTTGEAARSVAVRRDAALWAGAGLGGERGVELRGAELDLKFIEENYIGECANVFLIRQIQSREDSTACRLVQYNRNVAGH